MLHVHGDEPNPRYGHSLLRHPSGKEVPHCFIVKQHATQASSFSSAVPTRLAIQIWFEWCLQHNIFRHQVEFSNEVFALDWEEKGWKMIQEGSDGDGDNEEGKVMPSRRHFHSALLLNEDAGYRMVVFGGKSNGYHNDIWKYSLGIDCPPPFPQHKDLNLPIRSWIYLVMPIQRYY